jgi:hypothetical protein
MTTRGGKQPFTRDEQFIAAVVDADARLLKMRQGVH